MPLKKHSLPRPYVYSMDGGIHPDLAAEILGFTSGDDLVAQLANSVPMDDFISRQTDALMRERFPDLLTDPKLTDEAIKSLHNDKRAQLLRLELEHLASNDADSCHSPAPPLRSKLISMLNLKFDFRPNSDH